MLIERYSDSGFEPQLQIGHLIEDIEYYKRPWEENVEIYYNNGVYDEVVLRRMELTYLEHRDFYIDNEEYLRCGVWAFPFGQTDSFYLNHLHSGIPQRYVAEIPDDVICFLPDNQLKMQAIEFMGYPEMFIPEQSLVGLQIIEE